LHSSTRNSGSHKTIHINNINDNSNSFNIGDNSNNKNSNSNSNSNSAGAVTAVARMVRWFQKIVLPHITMLVPILWYYFGAKRRSIPTLVMLFLIVLAIVLEDQRITTTSSLRRFNTSRNVEWKQRPRVLFLHHNEQEHLKTETLNATVEKQSHNYTNDSEAKTTTAPIVFDLKPKALSYSNPEYEKSGYTSAAEVTKCSFVNRNWQTKTVAPSTCNTLHEVGLRLNISPSSSINRASWVDNTTSTASPDEIAEAAVSYYDRHDQYRIELLDSGGFKDVWYIVNENPGRVGDDKDRYYNQDFVLKTSLYERDFNAKNLDKHRRDALVMEQATKSPFVLDLYGYCSYSNLVQAARGTLKHWRAQVDLEEENNYFATPQEKSVALLKVATQLARGVADMQLFHYVDQDKNNVSNSISNSSGGHNLKHKILPQLLPAVAHADIKPAQFLLVPQKRHLQSKGTSVGSISAEENQKERNVVNIVEQVNRKNLVFQLNDMNRCRLLSWKRNNITTSSSPSLSLTNENQPKPPHPPVICTFAVSTKHKGSTWRSPEEYIKRGLQSDKIDVFSFGSVLYFLITGQAPFENVKFEEALYYISRDIEPPLNEFVNETNLAEVDPAMEVMIEVMRQCRRFNREDRPTSLGVATILEQAFYRLEQNKQK
jgi:hypothetical protein